LAIDANTSPYSHHVELCWKVQWDYGVTEKGSSGSPLYNMDGRVVGQLAGGFSACIDSTENNNEYSWYNKLSAAWSFAYINGHHRELSHWLDPNGIKSYSKTLDGRYLCEDEIIYWDYITADTTFNSGCCNEIMDEITIKNYSTVTVTADNDSVDICGNVTIENVTIQENSHLIINAAKSVTILSDFEVKVGSILEIN
jgi:lysyl endopeptidase